MIVLLLILPEFYPWIDDFYIYKPSIQEFYFDQGLPLYSYTYLNIYNSSAYVLPENTVNTDNNDKPIVKPDIPPTEEDGYKAPKGKPVKGRTKDGKLGWRDKHGNIWVPVPTGSQEARGGGHWDVNREDGKGYINVYPGGSTRPGKGKIPKF